MVAIKFIVEMVVIVVALAVAIFWMITNYQSVSSEFFSFFSDIPLFARGG